MIKKISKIYLFVWGLLFIPSFVSAAWMPGDPIVPNCARVSNDVIEGTNVIKTGCGFNDALILIDNIMQVFIWLTIPISTLLFAWIGWIFITKGDNPSALSEAKKKLKTLLMGLFFILGAWLLVKLIVSGLGGDTSVLLDIK